MHCMQLHIAGVRINGTFFISITFKPEFATWIPTCEAVIERAHKATGSKRERCYLCAF